MQRCDLLIYIYNLVNLIFLPTTSGRPILFCRMNKINDYRLLQYGSQAIERSWLIDHISYFETSKHNQTIFFTSYDRRHNFMGGFFSSVQGKESGVIYLWGFFEYAPPLVQILFSRDTDDLMIEITTNK